MPIPPSAILPNFTGEVIDNGRLQLCELLGSGAHGAVYRAVLRNPLPDALTVEFAVKCLLRAEPRTRGRKFQKTEIRLHKLVSEHPNVLTIHKVIEDEFYIFIVLDLCNGGDLEQMISKDRKLSRNTDLVKTVFLQLLDAVEFCHETDVFHRDLKPQNILCVNGGRRVLLADFGLASRELRARELGYGSLPYMSPECLDKALFDLGTYSTRFADIWALGVILVNMLTGHNPWTHASPKDNLYRAYLEDPNFFRNTFPLSQEACVILTRIFHRLPKKRISIAELRAEILNVNNFFMSDFELGWADGKVRLLAEAYAPLTSKSVQLTASDGTAVDGDVIQTGQPADLSTPDHTRPVGERESEPSIAFIVQNAPADGFTVGSASGSQSSDSSDSSVGPITPETIANDPGTDVPPLAQEGALGEPWHVFDADAGRNTGQLAGEHYADALAMGVGPAHVMTKANWRRPSASPVHMLKTAMRKISFSKQASPKVLEH